MKLVAPALAFVTLLSAFEAGAEPPAPKKGGEANNLAAPGERSFIEQISEAAGGAVGGYNGFWLDPGLNVIRIDGVARSICATSKAKRARVPRGDEYLVLVPGSRPTYAFDFSDSASAVRLDIMRASETKSVIGQSLGWLGIAALIGGLITVAVVDTKAGDTAGLVIAGGGALSLGIGIPLAISGAHSTAKHTPITPTARLVAVRGAF